MRIAFARLSHETHALSPLVTGLDAFERFHWRRGADLLDGCRPWRPETSQRALYNAELSGLYAATRLERDVALVPLTSAWAIPSGKLSAHAYAHLAGELLDHLRAAGPVDGLFLVLHGAMGVVGEPDPEGRLLADLRASLGPRAPIAVVYDLHAILTPSKVDPCALVAGYRTNPHRDHFAIGFRTARTFLRVLRREVAPVTAWRSLPMVVGGSPTLDLLAPMRPIYRRMKEMERDPRVLAVSIFQSQLWHDAPEAGWATVVHTDGDPALADRLADELADRLWDTRHHLPDDILDADAALDEVRRARWARRLGTVCLADTSDAVGCGSVGDHTGLLEALLAAPDLRSLVPLRDTEQVRRLWARAPGDAVDVEVGAAEAPEWSRPVRIRGRLASRHETGLWGRAVVLDAGHVQLVLTEASPMTISPSFYRDVGLEPLSADVVVVKSLFAFRLRFVRENRKTVYARTRGLTDMDVYERITYDRPVHPKDGVADWRPGDRHRRGR